MADDNTDVLMKLVPVGSPQAVPAECRTEIAKSMFGQPREGLLKGFTEGRFFEVNDFQFGVKLSDEDQTPDPTNKGTGKHGGAPAASRVHVEFQRWKSATTKESDEIPYPFRVGEFTFSRIIDKASPVLFNACANSMDFASAALVKRKVTGKLGLRPFLRFDFTDVLVTKLEWDDGEVIKERCTFVYRGLKMQYRKHRPDGDFDDSGLEPVEWSYDKELARRKGGSNG